MKTYFFENLFLKAFLFASKTKFSRKTFFEKILEKKKNFEIFFFFGFWKFWPSPKKGKMNYFLGKKVLDPHFFRKQIFLIWKGFENNFLIIFENRFYFMQKTIFVNAENSFLYSAENRFYTVQKIERQMWKTVL